MTIPAPTNAQTLRTYKRKQRNLAKREAARKEAQRLAKLANDAERAHPTHASIHSTDDIIAVLAGGDASVEAMNETKRSIGKPMWPVIRANDDGRAGSILAATPEGKTLLVMNTAEMLRRAAEQPPPIVSTEDNIMPTDMTALFNKLMNKPS